MSPESLESYCFKGLMQRAVQAYRDGEPVVVRDLDGSVLHGMETLKQIRDYGMELTCRVITGVDRGMFEASAWPEALEAHRRIFCEKWRDL